MDTVVFHGKKVFAEVFADSARADAETGHEADEVPGFEVAAADAVHFAVADWDGPAAPSEC